MLNLIYFTLLFTSVVFSSAKFASKKKTDEFVGDFLIGISTATEGFGRRQLMREQQFEPYKDGNFNITWKFTLLRPNSEEIREKIMQENQTYGDIIILEKYEDSRKNAIWIKPFEWFEYVEAYMPKYRYVAKMDDDTYMNITGLYEKKFTNKVKNQKMTVIAAFHIWIPDQQYFPHGGFYALSWDMMLQLNRLYETQPMTFTDELEDLQVAYFFKNASIPYNKVPLGQFSCEVLGKDGSGVMKNCNVTKMHLTGFENMIRVHYIKNDDIYKNVSTYFIKHEQELRAPQIRNRLGREGKIVCEDDIDFSDVGEFDPDKDYNQPGCKLLDSL